MRVPLLDALLEADVVAVDDDDDEEEDDDELVALAVAVVVRLDVLDAELEDVPVPLLVADTV